MDQKQLDLVSAAQAAQIIGITVARVYRLQDLVPVHPKPRLYSREDVERIAAEYKPSGRFGAQKRRG